MVAIKAILILILFKTVFGDQYNSFKNIYSRTKPLASKCINNIVRKSFPCGTLISVTHTRGGEIDLILSELGRDSCYNYIIRRYTDHNWLIPIKLYILTALNATSFSKGMYKLTRDIFWDPKAHTIIELEQPDHGDIEKVFDVLLRYNMFSVIFLRRLSYDNVTFYTYYPFKGTNCGLKYEYASIGNCNEANKTNYFSKAPISLRNCNVTVVANQDVPNFIFEQEGFTEDDKNVPGLEQYLLATIAEKEGIKMYYKMVPKDLSLGVVLPNNTATGLLNFLQRDEVDIAAGGIILIKNRMDSFEYIWGYNYAVFNLFTPAIGEEIWKDVYKEFSLKTWMLIILAYCTITVVSILVIKRWESRSLRNRGYITLKLWGYLYINTCKTLSKEVRMRRFMIFWIWFTFFISNFYNTALYSLLTNRDQIKRHVSVDDLHDLPFEPCISESTLTYFEFAMNKTLPAGRGLPECLYSDTALDYVASGNNAYAIELEYIYKLRENRYLDEDGRSKIDAWTFSTGNVIAMYLTRGFPRTQQFQNYAWRLYESGILREHLKKLHHNGKSKKSDHRQKHFKKILLADLRIHFFILVTGSILSLMCFILELVWFRI